MSMSSMTGWFMPVKALWVQGLGLRGTMGLGQNVIEGVGESSLRVPSPGKSQKWSIAHKRVPQATAVAMATLSDPQRAL